MTHQYWQSEEIFINFLRQCQDSVRNDFPVSFMTENLLKYTFIKYFLPYLLPAAL